MKLFGHPVHMMLVHFPAALFPMDLVCSFLALQTNGAGLKEASFCALSGGVGLGWLAVVFGTWDMWKIKDVEVKIKALVHGGINISVLTGYTVLVATAIKQYPQLPTDSWVKVILKLMLVVILLVGNHLGGSLILKYKIAVQDE